VLGFRRVDRGDETQKDEVVFEVGSGGPGGELRLHVNPNIPYGHLGAGGVHHIAWRTPDTQQHQQWRDRLASASLNVTPVIDRFYFKSIYFREPGGVLFEIATDGPGFATDEDIEHLGERLALPPFLEPYRETIEANLTPIAPPDLST
ncbi:MAG: VOC family protein, partial [Ktedonobacteraceae bacterium]|nr:VOC family protein [Ktedonobacteraceae bacterium]